MAMQHGSPQMITNDVSHFSFLFILPEASHKLFAREQWEEINFEGGWEVKEENVVMCVAISKQKL